MKATDQWQLLYMVHSAVPQPMEVFITYDIDFIPKAAAPKWKVKPAYPVWLDVRPSGYPVFNVQRRFGGKDQRCTWPKERCASFDPYGKKFIGQGRPGNGKGEDLVLPNAGESLGRIKDFQGGTLIGIGGHLHPGGIQNEIDLVRGKRSSRIYTGRAHYWDHKDPSRDGGPRDSWDFSMAVSGLPVWGARVKPGDHLRSNATYDTHSIASYEDMGIAVTYLAPDTPKGRPTAPGVDPFRAKHDPSRKCNGPQTGRLCTAGFITHGHYNENGNHAGKSGHWTLSTGGPANDVGILDFTYLPGDLNSGRPIPRVKLGTKLRFTNLEGAGIYHTVTSCAFPCLGETSASFPVPDGRTSKGRPIDLDSAELGIGAPYIGPTAQTISWQVPVTASTGFKPGEKVTYFCRVHPFMRGAFEVAK
jgi:plastocyanin